MPKCLTTKSFVERSKKIHGNKYTYGKAAYVNNRTNIVVTCKEHGDFRQIPDRHMNGSGCPECNRVSKIKSFDEKKARLVHGNKYDYSKVQYTGFKNKVTIVCPDHGEFLITPHSHIQGKQGCYSCGKGIMTQEQFLDKLKKKHGSDWYGYEKVEYTNTRNKIILICPIHGAFHIRANHALDGKGCAKCSYESRKMDFVAEATKVHGGRYNYQKTNYVHANDYVTIECERHGSFRQRAMDHIRGCGCPKCASHISGAEQEIYDFVKSLCDDAIQNDRNIIKPLELDVLVPSKGIAIEYCGLFWHSVNAGGKDSTYHLRKMDLCQEKGLRLLTIFEDEWLSKPEVVKSVIRNKLGKSERGPGARSLEVRQVDLKAAKGFTMKYHLQGNPHGTTYRLGAFDGDDLVAVMMFGSPTRQSPHQTELKRFCTDGKSYAGLASKMFKKYLRDASPESVVSFADLRWADGGVYYELGFESDGVVSPDYHYITTSGKNQNKRRMNKSGFRKDKIASKFGVSVKGKTERQLMEELGYDRIYDCGKIRFVWISK